MAIQFDTTKIAAFRNLTLKNETTIANLDGKGGIKAHGNYTGWFSSLSRSDEECKANNAARTALLKSLGQAFGLEGVSEKDGLVTFSKGFMDRLTQILGNEVFKRDDFKVRADGIVKSGRPLTKRRIEAIVNKAIMVSSTNFDTAIFRMKMDVIKKELGIYGLSKEELENKMIKKNALRMFVIADQGLNVLENKLFLAHQIVDKNTHEMITVYGPKNDRRDNSFIRVNPDYLYYKESGMSTKGVDMYQLACGDGMYTAYTKSDRDVELRKFLPGQVFHLERAHSDGKTPEDMEKLKKYIFGTIQLVVQKMIDLYFESKAQGKLNAFMGFLAYSPGACMEDKGLHLSNFEISNLKNDTTDNVGMSKEEIAEYERIADLKQSADAPAPKTDDLVYGVINSLYMTDDSFKTKDDWAKDFAVPVKEKLVGKTAQIMRIELDEERNEYKFTPMLDLNNQPVVRPLTAEDIDEMGRACLHNVNG